MIEVIARLASDLHKNKNLRDDSRIWGVYAKTLKFCIILAEAWRSKGQNHWQRDYLQDGVDLTSLVDPEGSRQLRIAIAESFVEEATSRGDRSKIVKSSLLEHALRIFSELGMNDKSRMNDKSGSQARVVLDVQRRNPRG